MQHQPERDAQERKGAMPEYDTLDQLLTNVAAARTKRRDLEQKHWDLGLELNEADKAQAVAEAEMKAELTRLMDTKPTGQRGSETVELRVHLTGEEIAKAVARHAGGGDDYRR